ncbi:DUF4349 domain-containing protein [bacterium]|nr:DUF4349 domain-containing protein [bacterium]
MSKLMKHCMTALLALLFVCALSGCMKASRDSMRDVSATRSQAPMEGMAGGAMAPGAPMDNLSAESAPGAEEARKAGSSGPQLKPEDFLKQQVDIESWFSPKAYAAENIPDTKYLIRTGDITLRIKNYDESAKSVEATAEKYGGIVTDSNSAQQYDGSRNGYLKLRVPNEQFRACYDELKELGEVTAENVSSVDVSHDYVTAVSRLKALLTEQETLRNMLAEAREVQKTRGLGEAYSVLLETQGRLSEVTAQIQGIEDQISQLADQITRSTITVNLNEIAQIPSGGKYEPGYGTTFEEAKLDLVRTRDAIIRGIIYFFIAGWLQLLPWAIAVWVIWLLYKRWQKKRRAETVARASRGPAEPQPRGGGGCTIDP